MSAHEMLDSYGSIFLERNDDGRSFVVSGQSIPTSSVTSPSSAANARNCVVVRPRWGRPDADRS
ncbi:hypothetical protein [Rhodococcus sp. OK302]|uniref:hypothetical protein n=1 Tax=Rhodococcus sp. OK302 TaxID=1882769 RepID=UPI000B9462B4|nr:hypothetical protein [Rhodococcus sp. OK302]